MRKVPKLRFKEFSDEWKEKRLGECIIYKKGYAFKSEDFIENGIRIVRVSDLGEKNIKNNDKVYIADDKYSLYKEWEIKENDIILTTVGSRPPLYSSMVGKPILVVNKKETCLLNQNSVLLRSKNEQLQKIIFNIFLKKRYINHIENIARGNANQANITLDDLFDYKVNIPVSFQEQEKIANFLTNIDKKISLTEEKLELFREYKKGVMQKIFSQELRFKDSNGNDYPEWEEKRLGEISEICTGKKDLEDKKEDGVYPFFVRSKNIEKIDTYSYDGEAILIPGDGKIGEVFHYINGKFDYHQRVYKISNFKNIIGKYAYYFLENNFKKHALTYTVKATVDSLRLPIIKEFIIYLPTLEEQQKIADFLSSIDSKIESIEKELEGLKEFKKGLLQQIFV